MKFCEITFAIIYGLMELTLIIHTGLNYFMYDYSK